MSQQPPPPPPNYFLSHNINFSQTQTGTTVPLKKYDVVRSIPS